MNRSGKILVVIIVAGVLGSSGCISPPKTVRQAFMQARPRLEIPLQDLLLESLQVLSLLENYRLSLEGKDIEQHLRCFSPRFSHYEKGLNWVRSRTEEDYFQRFQKIAVELSGLQIEMVKARPAIWLKQEAFDWLQGQEAETSFSRPYLLLLRSEGAGADILFQTDEVRHPGRRRSSSSREPEAVAVRLRFDPLIEYPLGEASFELLIQARSEMNDLSGDYAYALEEKVTFLLEKEGGRWKIVSRR